MLNFLSEAQNLNFLVSLFFNNRGLETRHIFSVNLTALDENEMQMAMLGYQPVSIAFEVVNDFMHYKNGTYSSFEFSN